MTAVRVQDPVRVFSDGSFVGSALSGLNFTGDVIVSTSGSFVNVVVTSVQETVWNEVPSGSIDGINMSFSLSDSPISGRIMLFQNGIKLDEGASNDYVLSGSMLSMLTAPLEGDKLVASYRRRSQGVTRQWDETPSGSIDGANQDFYLAHGPYGSSLMLFLNGRLLLSGSDYDLIPANLVRVVPASVPIFGDKLRAYYEYIV